MAAPLVTESVVDSAVAARAIAPAAICGIGQKIERFSIIIFSRWGKEKIKKAGNYTGFGKYLHKWRNNAYIMIGKSIHTAVKLK